MNNHIKDGSGIKIFSCEPIKKQENKVSWAEWMAIVMTIVFFYKICGGVFGW